MLWRSTLELGGRRMPQNGIVECDGAEYSSTVCIYSIFSLVAVI